MCLISGTVWSTPLPWLPVLTNIEPPALWCRAATDKLITQAECPPWLAIIWRRLLPSSTSPGIAQTTVEGLAVNWCHKSVEGRLAIGYGGQFHFSGSPTIRLPGFDLHRRQWSLLNRFRTCQGHCNACHKKWGFTDNELCDCGEIPDNVTHRQLLSIGQVWRRSTALAWSRRGCRRLADNIWLLAHDHNNNTDKAARKYDHVTQLLMDLHWLWVPQRIQYKLCVLVHGCLNGAAPGYLSDLTVSVASAARRRLHSASTSDLVATSTRRASIGDRAFAVAGPREWNSLPPALRSTSTFKKELKSFLFGLSFCLWQRIPFIDYVQRSSSCLYRRLRYRNCLNYITLQRLCAYHHIKFWNRSICRPLKRTSTKAADSTKIVIVPVLQWQKFCQKYLDPVREIGLLDFPGFGFVGHYDQGWFVLEVDVLSEILTVCDSGRAQVDVLTWRGGWFHYWCGPRRVVSK